MSITSELFVGGELSSWLLRRFGGEMTVNHLSDWFNSVCQS